MGKKKKRHLFLIAPPTFFFNFEGWVGPSKCWWGDNKQVPKKQIIYKNNFLQSIFSYDTWGR
jgi:hypothetical protein